jgi:serine/threonine protein phosphatase PrpC
MVRVGNEDSMFADANPYRGVFMVADGMGGHAAGEVASAMAVQIVTRDIAQLRDVSSPHAAEILRGALQDANRAIFNRTISEVDKQGMGTTASVLILSGNRYLIGQVGDSRIYRARNGTLEQLTKDHSYVQEQVDAGYITPEQARYHPYSNVITRCVGASPEVEPDVYSGELQPGDVFLVASDGLTGMLEDAHLQRLVLGKTSPGALVDALVHEANRRGGLDNITAVVVRVAALDDPRLDADTSETPVYRPTPTH